MKRRLFLIILLATVTLSGMAQNIGEAFYIYRNDGIFNAFLREEVLSIEYSYQDSEGNNYDEIVTQIINTADSIYYIPISSIDSISFIQPETKYKSEVLRMNENWIPYIVSVSDETITFKESTPATFLPEIGEVIVAETFDSPFETGFSGRVTKCVNTAEGIMYNVDAVGLPDIYEHLVSTGISASESSDTETFGARRKIWGMNDTPGVRFPIPNIDIPLGPVTISCVPDIVLKYIVCIGEKNLKDYIDIKVHQRYEGSVKIDCKFDNDYKPEPKWNKAFIPISTGIPGLYGKIMFGGFIRAAGSVQLSATQPFTITGISGFDYSQNTGFNGVNEWNATMGDTEFSLSLDGSLSAGLALRLQLGIIHERIASADITAYVGPQITGHLGLSSTGAVDKNLYSSIKDSEITLSFGAEIVPGYRYFAETEHKELPVSLNLSYPLNHWYAVPEFDNLTWTADDNGTGGYLNADINRNLLPKVRLGWGLYDDYDNLYQSYYLPQEYRKIEDWHNNGLEYYIESLPYGQHFKAYPLVSLFGMEMRANTGVDIGLAPLVKNIGISDITANSVTVSGYVEGLSHGMVVDAGVCYSTNPILSTLNYVSAKTKADGEYSVTITELEPNTTYYYRAYAYIDGVYYYAEDILSFKTNNIDIPVKIIKFEQIDSEYNKSAFINDGNKYSYRFDCTVTIELTNSKNIEDWGYVYEDPNGKTVLLSLIDFESPFTDTRYSYYRNEAISNIKLYEYVKFKNDAEYYYSNPKEYPVKHSNSSCPDYNHPHMIDLGLPSGTKWACCNVGATVPEGPGGYYAWGETNWKKVYNMDTYQYGNAEGDCVDIGADIAGTNYDAATINWGAPWRMPSSSQLLELFTYCISTWVPYPNVVSQIRGLKLKGPNGNFIFLPAAGEAILSAYAGYANSGYYWSSELSEQYDNRAQFLTFDRGGSTLYHGGRGAGKSIRPVCK